MTIRLRFCGFQLALVGAGLAAMTAAHAVELDPKAVAVQTPDQFKWRDPANQAATNQATLLGDPTKAGLHIVINKFKPNRFGTPHYHTHDRYIVVVDGAPWRGTGPVVDWSHATRVPKGTFMIDHAGKVHWDGTKEESGAYLIADVGPDSQTQITPSSGPWTGGDPSAATITFPDQIAWKDNGGNRTADLFGDPSKPGLYVQLLSWKKGNNFSRPHSHPNDRFITVLSGTWWVGTGTKFDPANLTVPFKEGTFVTHFGKGVHWDGARDEDTTLLIIGDGPATAARAEEAK